MPHKTGDNATKQHGVNGRCSPSPARARQTPRQNQIPRAKALAVCHDANACRLATNVTASRHGSQWFDWITPELAHCCHQVVNLALLTFLLATCLQLK